MASNAVTATPVPGRTINGSASPPPPFQVAEASQIKNAAVVAAAPAREAIVDAGASQRVVQAGLPLIAREMDKGLLDDKWREFRAALRELHLDIAGARFDDALPKRLQGRELVGSRAGQAEEPLP